MILSLLFIMLAAMCNAVMDNLSHHWYKSVFNRYNPNFWNPGISWQMGFIPGTKYKLDAWHLFKSCMIILVCLSVISFDINQVFVNAKWYSYLIIIITYGAAWNGTFNLFYNRILNKKMRKL